MFLSQRPNNDPQQWEHRVTGQRYADPYEAGTEAGLCDDNPRPEFTQSRDPLPVKNLLTPDRYPDMDNALHFAGRDASLVAWNPRHEEFDTPVNGLLASFREECLGTTGKLIAMRAQAWLNGKFGMDNNRGWDAHSPEVVHALRVLSKLVAVYS